MRLDHITSSGFDAGPPAKARPSSAGLSKEAPLDLGDHVDRRQRPCYVPSPHASVARLPANIGAQTATLHPLPGDNSCVEPPDPIPNSEVKRTRADGSVAQAMQE